MRASGPLGCLDSTPLHLDKQMPIHLLALSFVLGKELGLKGRRGRGGRRVQYTLRAHRLPSV